MFDNYAARHKVRGHSLIDPFNAQAFAKAQKFCRVGAVANTGRLAINALRSRGSPPSSWRNSRAWRSVLPDSRCISAHSCATLYCLAADDSRRDWSSECNIFRAGTKAYLKMRINLPGSIPGRSMLILGAITLMPPALLGIVNLRCMATVDTMLNLEQSFLRRSNTFKTARYTLSRRSTLSARLPLASPIGMDTKKALYIPPSFQQ